MVVRAVNGIRRTNVSSASRASSADVALLIRRLYTGTAHARQSARQSLVALGGPAIGPLTDILLDPKQDWEARWEAAKALGEMGTSAVAPTLVRALEDPDFGVRWVAAEGLADLGRAGLPALMRGLIERPNSIWLRRRAHQALRMLAERGHRELVAPVLAALEGTEPQATLPIAAERVLAQLTRTENRVA